MESGVERATGSGDVVASQRAACRQNSSWLRSVDDASMRQRHDASPPKIIARPWPYRWTATTGKVPPSGDDTTASTDAPGRGGPNGADAASAGRAAHFARVS